MNKKTISILCLTAIYSILFYEQHVGINFLLFTLAALGFFFFQDKAAFKSKAVIGLGAAAIFTASSCVVYGSNLSMWATIVALAVIPGAFMNKRSSIFIDYCTSIVTAVVSFCYMVIDLIESHKSGKGKGFLRLLKYIVPTVFVITFFFIYRAMNPLFERFTQEIAEFLSLGWVFFTLGGFFLVYSFYKQRRATKIDEWEKNWPLHINSETVKDPKWNEGIAFSLLFVVLNLMLVAVNAMDLNYLYLGEGMPDGITHKEFVHKGVGMLILSIVLGISILLFFFRGKLNFGKSKMIIKALAFLWVLQNAFMVVSTSLRNTMYIDESLLTYKRIGVYFWLFFALIGLITLFIKLFQNRTVWFLARHNFVALFIVLVASASLDWDMVISDFNLNRAHQKDQIADVDKNYMLSLPEGNIAGLYEIKGMEGFEIDSVYSYSYSFDRFRSNTTWLDAKVFDFLEDDAYGDWRSYSARRIRVRNEIQELHKQGKIDRLELQSHYIKSIEPLYALPHLKELNLNNNSFSYKPKLAGINGLKELEKLYLNENYIESLDTLSTNKNLTHLELAGNQIKNLKFLKSFPNLDSLELSRNQIQGLSSLPVLAQLKSLHLDGNPLNDLARLSNLPNLQRLSLNDVAARIGNFPELKKVWELSITNSKYTIWYSFNNVNSMPSLEVLNVSYNELTDFDELVDRKNMKSKFPVLTSLSMSSNKLQTIYDIRLFEQLTFLDLSNNEIYSTVGLEEALNLRKLYLSNNKIKSVKFLEGTKKLNRLDLSSNFYLKDTEALANLNMLNYLNLSNTGIKNIQYINSYDKLQNLNLSGCRIKAWHGLKNYTALETLSISYIKKEDVKYIKQLKSLKNLYLTNTEDEVIELLKEELTEVEIY